MHQGNVRPLRGVEKSNPILGRRWKTHWAATLQTAAAQMSCIVVDVSVTGARVRTFQIPSDGDNVSLLIGTNDAISARVAWRSDDSAGLCFAEDQPRILRMIPFAESKPPSSPFRPK
jgi:PilZ domain